MSKPFLKRTAIAAAAAFAVVAGGSVPAVADDGDYCWTKTDLGTTTCYNSEEARDNALAAAGVITPGMSAAARSAVEAKDVSVMASFVWAIAYEDRNYLGDSHTLTATGTSCTSTTASGWVLQSSWRNRISSIRVYGGCTVKLWSGANFTGTSFGWIGSVKFVDALNDKVQSIQYKKSV